MSLKLLKNDWLFNRATGEIVARICATKDFKIKVNRRTFTISEGTIGGYMDYKSSKADYYNSPYTDFDCSGWKWVDQDSIVCGYSRLYGNVYITGKSLICSSSVVNSYIEDGFIYKHKELITKCTPRKLAKITSSNKDSLNQSTSFDKVDISTLLEIAPHVYVEVFNTYSTNENDELVLNIGIFNLNHYQYTSCVIDPLLSEEEIDKLLFSILATQLTYPSIESVQTKLDRLKQFLSHTESLPIYLNCNSYAWSEDIGDSFRHLMNYYKVYGKCSLAKNVRISYDKLISPEFKVAYDSHKDSLSITNSIFDESGNGEFSSVLYSLKSFDVYFIRYDPDIEVIDWLIIPTDKINNSNFIYLRTYDYSITGQILTCIKVPYPETTVFGYGSSKTIRSIHWNHLYEQLYGNRY